MNNKPVACVYQKFGVGRVAWLTKMPPDGTKLYIHPVKELTNEEIMEIAKNCGWETGDSWDDCVCCSKFCLESFAKAILRKAQDK